MSDWTTPEDVPEVVRERLHDWLNAGHPAQATTLANYAVAEVIRAFWPAPARTLADDLAHIAEHWETWATDTITEELTAATTRAEQTERDRDEALAEVERERDLGVALAHERDDARAELEREYDLIEARDEVDQTRSELSEVTHARDSLREDYDHARAEVERLRRDLDGAYKTRDARDDEVYRLRAEVERLEGLNFEKDVREAINDHYDHYAAQKSAESNAETPNPADVPPGEAWIVEVNGERRTALKDDDGLAPWNHVDSNGLLSLSGNKSVTLITRLVPAPRVITDHDELDRLAEGAVILSLSTQYALQRVNAGDGWYCPATKGKATSTDVLSCGPVTVLWEPVA